MDGNQIVTDPSADWASKSSPYAADDPSPSYSPYLPPVFEELCKLVICYVQTSDFCS